LKTSQEAMQQSLAKLEGVPQALVALAERLSANSVERVESNAAQQKALKALTDKVDTTVGGGKKYVIGLLWSLVITLSGIIGYLAANYVLPKP